MQRNGEKSVSNQAKDEKPLSKAELMMAETDRVETAIQAGVRDALILHKRAGNPIAVWEDGRVVIIPPEEIVIPDEPLMKEKE